jgi:hypothetical protein
MTESKQYRGHGSSGASQEIADVGDPEVIGRFEQSPIRGRQSNHRNQLNDKEVEKPPELSVVSTRSEGVLAPDALQVTSRKPPAR